MIIVQNLVMKSMSILVFMLKIRLIYLVLNYAIVAATRRYTLIVKNVLFAQVLRALEYKTRYY